ncbi:MAG TPA: nuclear transport factor 2 family protein [Acidimicrobiales bacterium]|nr:nuclear transport factor 2 family protein [Acidimicrobiales bacterium]
MTDAAVGAAAREIRALLARYGERMDAGDWQGVGELFARATIRNSRAPDVVVAQGAAALTALLQRTIRLYDGLPLEQHVTANSIIDVDLDAGFATARSAYVVFMAAPGFPLQATGAGRYHDRFAHAGDGWHFTERLFIQELHGNLSAHTA